MAGSQGQGFLISGEVEGTQAGGRLQAAPQGGNPDTGAAAHANAACRLPAIAASCGADPAEDARVVCQAADSSAAHGCHMHPGKTCKSPPILLRYATIQSHLSQ